MERKKHLAIFIGLCILTALFGLLNYLAWIEDWQVEQLQELPYMLLIPWIFITILTIGFAAAFPRKKIKEEKTVDFIPVEQKLEEKDEEGEKEVVFEEVPAAAEKIIGDKYIKEVPQSQNNIKLNQEIKQLEGQLPSDVVKFAKESAKLIAEELAKILVIEENIENPIAEKDFISDIKNHVEKISKEKTTELDNKIDSTLHSNADIPIHTNVPTNTYTNTDAERSIRQRTLAYLRNNPDATLIDIIRDLKINEGTARIYLRQWKKKKTR